MSLEASQLELQVVEQARADGGTDAVLKISNHGEEALAHNWRLYFSLGLKPVDEDKRFDRVLIDGRYGYLAPTDAWQALGPGKQTVIPLEPWLFQGMPLRAKQGFHITWLDGGSNRLEPRLPTLAAPALLPLDSLPNKWIEDISPSCDTNPDTPGHRWQKNQQSIGNKPAVTVIPSPASFNLSGEIFATKGLDFDDSELARVLADYQVEDGLAVTTDVDSELGDEHYLLDVNQSSVTIRAGSPSAVFYAAQSLRQLIQTQADLITLPVCQIDDRPDLQHRGLFVDLARHFVDPTEIKKVIQAMAAYKMNVLQLGLSNDEGFRLEIPGIPELTEIGARRTFHADDETGQPRGLFPAWGDGPEEVWQFLNTEDFTDLLAFADEHHISIIPELNLPAHANAMIRAMQASGRYEITDADDASVHQSAQGYSNNVANVCMPDTFALAAEIIEAITACYRAAGTPLSALHLGGDEVPAGAWLQSPVCRNTPLWDESWQLTSEADCQRATEVLTRHYARQITALADELIPDTALGFWHEMSPTLPDTPNTYITGWTTETGDRDLIQDILDRGQQLVIANASFLYLDMPYSLHAAEPGLPWAAYIDESLIYHFSPLENWGISESQQPQVRGMQAQLWSETIYSAGLMNYYLFPRTLAVAERAWRTKPNPAAWPDFAAALGSRELPYLEQLGIQFRMPPPGVKVEHDQLYANTVFPGLVIRYTKDGTDPTKRSAVYRGPVTVGAAHEIRLATFSPKGDIVSRTVSSILN